jgi:branched-chain amino acid aminotransferase
VTEFVTPPLDDIVLPGITRDSVIAVAREHGSGVNPIAGLPDKLVVSERPITMGEVRQAARDGTLLEVFGCGTCPAPVVAPCYHLGPYAPGFDAFFFGNLF